MRAQRRQVFEEINITPLTDIFLVLLIIMMVVAPLLEYRQLDIALVPGGEVSIEDSREDAKVVEILVDARGRYTVGGKDVALASLVSEIKTQSIEMPEGVYIETHPDASWEALAQAMDAAQAARAVRVKIAESVIDEPAAKPEPAPAPKTKTKKK